MSDITNPHDAFFKQFMTRPEIVIDVVSKGRSGFNENCSTRMD
jgi:hypothetical protein